MRKFTAALAFLLITTACSAGRNSTPNLPPQAPAATLTIKIALQPSGIAETLPPVDGVSTSLSVPANNAPSGTTLSITISNSAPAGMPAIPAAQSRAFVYYAVTSSADATLNGVPAFHVTLPSATHDQGQFYAWTYSATHGWTDWGAVNVSGSAMTFGGTSKPTVLQKGAQLIVVPFTAIGGVSCGTPSPSPSPSPTPIAILTPSPVQTFSPGRVPHYTFVALPTDFRPEEINDNGVIVGYMQEIATAAPHAALYENGQLHFLGSLPGDSQSEAFGINNKNEAVGMSINPESVRLESVLYSGGHVYDLHEGGRAAAINNEGVIAGMTSKTVVLFDASTCTPILFASSSTPFAYALVNRINDAGQYVGELDVASEYETYVGSGSEMHPLGIMGYANDINDHGDIVGNTANPQMPFIRDGASGGITVPVLPGFTSGSASAINDAGQVVGYSYMGDIQDGFLYQSGKIVSLEQATGKRMLQPVDINNRGEIIVFDNTQVPENAYFAAAGVLEPIR